MTIEEARQALQMMKSHFDSGFSHSEQRVIEDLYTLIFRKHIARSGCQDCYRDAYILINLKIKNMEKLPSESSYKLKAGIVLRKFGTNELFCLDMEDRDAEAWLKERPQDITKFQKYPEDWEQRISRVADEKVKDEEIPAVKEKTAANGVKSRSRRRSASKKK